MKIRQWKGFEKHKFCHFQAILPKYMLKNPCLPGKYLCGSVQVQVLGDFLDIPHYPNLCELVFVQSSNLQSTAGQSDCALDICRQKGVSYVTSEYVYRCDGSHPNFCQPHVQSAFEPCHCQRVEFFSVTVFALGGTIYVIQDIEQVMKRGIETGTCCDYCYCLHTYH